MPIGWMGWVGGSFGYLSVRSDGYYDVREKQNFLVHVKERKRIFFCDDQEVVRCLGNEGEEMQGIRGLRGND